MNEARRNALQDSGSQVLLLLQGLSRAVVLYEPNNKTVQRLVDMLDEALGEFLALESELRLQLRTDEFFANGKLLKLDPTNYERFSELGTILAKYDAGEIRFEKGVNRTHIESFVGGLAVAQRSSDGSLERSYGRIKLATFKGRSMASFRMEPDKLAVWLYSGLLDIVERLYTAHADGETPSLLPVRRILQLVIDNMRRHGAIYQLLTNVRDHAQRVDHVRLRSAICIDVIGLGIWLGLDNNQLMILGLAAITGGLSEDRDPEARLRPLFRYAGLAETAMPLVVTVHDAAAARRGDPAGMPGRLLSVVETFHQAVSRPRPGQPMLPEAKVIAGLAAGKFPGIHVGAARIFGAYKGRFPLGTPVRLSDGRLAVVYSHGLSENGKATPQVGIVENGRIVERIDLAESELKIAAIPAPDETPLVLDGATRSSMKNAPGSGQLGVDVGRVAESGLGEEDQDGDHAPADTEDDPQVDEPAPGLTEHADGDDQADDPDDQAPAHHDALPGGVKEPHAEEGGEE